MLSASSTFANHADDLPPVNESSHEVKLKYGERGLFCRSQSVQA
jgi:hypothetical protein